jgi:peroxiredoxin
MALSIGTEAPDFALCFKSDDRIKIAGLSDSYAVAKAYDVVYESFLPQLNLIMRGVAKRSAFIVDKGCVIRYFQSSDNPRDLPDFEAVKTELKRLV